MPAPALSRVSQAFAHFMSAVGFFMGRNPRASYHNLYHAVDVMHATYFALDGMGASGMLNEMEELALILSALCHDLDHPGLTNSFQVSLDRLIATQLRGHRRSMKIFFEVGQVERRRSFSSITEPVRRQNTCAMTLRCLKK